MARDHGHPGRPDATRIAMHAVAWLIGIVYLVPLLWIGVLAIKPADQASAADVSLLPRMRAPAEAGAAPGTAAPELSKTDPRYWSALAGQASDNFHEVWASPSADFPTYLRNSVIVTLLSVIGVVATSSLVAFGFARLHWPGRDKVFLVVIATMMIPQVVVLPPLYVLFRQLGLVGTLAPLWLPMFFGGALGIFLLRQFYSTIPRELDEAARIDGCSSFGVYWRIILPLSKPALITVALFQVVGSWNEFLAPLVFLNHDRLYTLPLGLQQYQTQQGGTPWNLVMAASCLVILPVLILYGVTRPFFTGGIAGEGLKE